MNTTVLVLWQRFGPYHIARLEAAHVLLQQQDLRLIGFETASLDGVYRWREESVVTSFERITLHPGKHYDSITRQQVFRSVWRKLNDIDPDAIAICGYTSVESISALAWCRFHRKPAVLMSDSKQDDAPRRMPRETIKRYLVSGFSAGLCGGRLAREYLIRLGMKPERVFLGYDAVNNEYFAERARIVRQNQEDCCNLPGLSNHHKFFLASSRFIARKNLEVLIRAYGQYRQALASSDAETPWRLVILGDGEERTRLLNIVEQERIDGVVWPGFRQIEELPAYYGLASAFIHPALQEQWGLVVNEAMASGLPVFVSNTCGCVPELVVEGVTGCTFTPTDIRRLTALMLDATLGRIDLAGMGRAAQRHIRQWGPERFAEGLLNAIRSALLTQ